MTTIHNIRLAGTDVEVCVLPSGQPVQTYVTDLNKLPLFLIELAAHFGDVAGVAIKNITDSAAVIAAVQGIRTALPGVAIEANERHVLATTFSGDAKTEVTDAGTSALNAIAKLLTTHGFKSKAFDASSLHFPEQLTVDQWLVDFRYGFKRKSDEKLQEELQGLLKPDIGSW